MNQATRQRRKRAAEQTAADRIKQLEAAKDQLLDIVNILLLREGGTVVIPLAEMQAATRHSVHVDLRAPDPERAGDTGHYTIRLDGLDDERAPGPPGLRERLRGRLWLPGQP